MIKKDTYANKETQKRADEIRSLEETIGFDTDANDNGEQCITTGNFQTAEGDLDRLIRLGLVDKDGKSTDSRIL